jgi:putative ABC transport system permease protein
MINVESLAQDVRSACRALWRVKPFTSAAVLTLAVGIAGTTVMFALIQGVLLRPLPVQQQDRLVVAWKEVQTSGSARYPFGNTEIEAVAEASRLLESAAGVTRNGVGRSVVTDNGVSSYANVGLVTGGFFEVLGARPALGRTFTAADDKDGAEPVIVITNGFWQRRYGSSREILGRQVRIGERPFTIVGVMPPDLDYPTGIEIWALTTSVPPEGFGIAARREVNLIGRMRPGVTVEQAASEITALNQQLPPAATTGMMRGLVPVVRSFVDLVVGDVRRALIALFAAVGLVLLIASANVANLLLLRGEGRRAEMALRTALGAGRERIVRQVLAESAVIALLAGACGFALAWWGVRGLVQVVPDGLPRLEAIRIDAMVVLFCFLATFVTALAAGLIPALSSLRVDLVSPLRSSGHGLAGTSANRARRALVVAQVALAVSVLAGTGLLIRSVLRLQAIDLGMAADRLVMLDLYVPPPKVPERRQHAQFLDQAIAELQAVPTISAVTPVNIPPFSDRGWDTPRVTAEGQGEAQAEANPSLNLESIHPNYFDTLRIPMLRGRSFTTADREDSQPVAIVSEDVAAALWPQQDPIGKRLKMGPVASQAVWRTVVGVAAVTRYRTLTTPRPTLYLPATQFQMTATNLVLRTTASLELLASSAVARLQAIDSDVRVMRIEPFTEMLDRPLARPRFNAFLLGIFGSVALLLSTVGLYAVMAAYVRQRDREIALRLALGASAASVRRFVLAETVRLAGLGSLIGVVAATATGRLLRGMLFEVDPLDPWTTLGAAVLLVAAAGAASYLPVRRATRVDAIAMLRAS